VRSPSDPSSDFTEFPGLLHPRKKNFEEYLPGIVEISVSF